MQQKRINFLESEEAKEIKHQLEQMVTSKQYNTASSYSVNSSLYSDNLIPFVDKHMTYLANHPNLQPSMYISNIKLMTRIR